MPYGDIYLYLALVSCAFGLGIILAFVLISAGQRKRAGAISGIILSVPASVPAGIMCGWILWSRFEEISWLPHLCTFTLGPFAGAFAGTFCVSLVFREFASRWRAKEI